MTGIHPQRQRQRVLSTQWTDLTKTSTTAALELVDIHDNTTAMTDVEILYAWERFIAAQQFSLDA